MSRFVQLFPVFALKEPCPRKLGPGQTGTAGPPVSRESHEDAGGTGGSPGSEHGPMLCGSWGQRAEGWAPGLEGPRLVGQQVPRQSPAGVREQAGFRPHRGPGTSEPASAWPSAGSRTPPGVFCFRPLRFPPAPPRLDHHGCPMSRLPSEPRSPAPTRGAVHPSSTPLQKTTPQTLQSRIEMARVHASSLHNVRSQTFRRHLPVLVSN